MIWLITVVAVALDVVVVVAVALVCVDIHAELDGECDNDVQEALDEATKRSFN